MVIMRFVYQSPQNRLESIRCMLLLMPVFQNVLTFLLWTKNRIDNFYLFFLAVLSKRNNTFFFFSYLRVGIFCIFCTAAIVHSRQLVICSYFCIQCLNEKCRLQYVVDEVWRVYVCTKYKIHLKKKKMRNRRTHWQTKLYCFLVPYF